MLCTFTRPLALHTRTHGLMHVQAAYAKEMVRCIQGPMSDSVRLVITMVIRCDGARRDLEGEELTVFVQPHEIMAAQDTRF